MSKEWVIGITTYQKSNALRTLLQSLKDHGYFNLATVHIADDNAGDSYTITRKDNPHNPAWEGIDESVKSLEMPSAAMVAAEFGCPITFGKTKQAGIAKNKNRGIQYFKEQTNAQYLVLLDDDIEFIGPGMLEALQAGESIKHITGYLADSNMFEIFPPEAGNEHVVFCRGSQGVMLFVTRQVVEEVGYFDHDWKGKYGYEHTIYSNRINRFYGFFIDRFAVLRDCGKYFVSQQVPNNYEPDYIKKGGEIQKDPGGTPLFQNTKQHEKRKIEVFNGIHLTVKGSGV